MPLSQIAGLLSPQGAQLAAFSRPELVPQPAQRRRPDVRPGCQCGLVQGQGAGGSPRTIAHPDDDVGLLWLCQAVQFPAHLGQRGVDVHDDELGRQGGPGQRIVEQIEQVGPQGHRDSLLIRRQHETGAQAILDGDHRQAAASGRCHGLRIVGTLALDRPGRRAQRRQEVPHLPLQDSRPLCLGQVAQHADVGGGDVPLGQADEERGREPHRRGQLLQPLADALYRLLGFGPHDPRRLQLMPGDKVLHLCPSKPGDQPRLSAITPIP